MHGAKERGARTKLGPPRAGERTLRNTQKQSRRQAPAFWDLVGLTVDGQRAHPRHTW